MRFEYVSWSRFASLCGVLYRRIDADGYKPDLIVAVTRGGYPVARVLADYFGVLDLVTLKIEHYRGPDKMRSAVVRYPLPLDIPGRRVLLVDDVCDSGDTFAVALRHLDAKGPPAALRTAVLHHKQTSGVTPDYHARRVLKWRWITYPWALVEDLTSLVARMEGRPETVEALGERLAAVEGLELPSGVLEEVGPIVLARAREADINRL
ncbi:MAG: phosphoribosyltransferase [Thiocapsa sp.]|jgi:hypothetical protein|nr:phosphoribosyltransferase [Thiocapsa sp.]MCG6895812.1 phosphoribosyltransferase [Thiocapsa sp.]MCG6985757.1 phosphoribosyltransferase [Thiocapsa sp.]